MAIALVLFFCHLSNSFPIHYKPIILFAFNIQISLSVQDHISLTPVNPSEATNPPHFHTPKFCPHQEWVHLWNLRVIWELSSSFTLCLSLIKYQNEYQIPLSILSLLYHPSSILLVFLHAEQASPNTLLFSLALVASSTQLSPLGCWTLLQTNYWTLQSRLLIRIFCNDGNFLYLCCLNNSIHQSLLALKMALVRLRNWIIILFKLIYIQFNRHMDTGYCFGQHTSRLMLSYIFGSDLSEISMWARNLGIPYLSFQSS